MRLPKKLKLIFKAALVFFSAAAGFFVCLFVGKKQNANRQTKTRLSKAEGHKAKTYEKIKNTDGNDLVNAACNADELHAIADDIKQDAAHAIQARIRQSGL
jgi:hypothetical protein